MEGYLSDGKTPKNRLVFAPETKRRHGKLAGSYKYCDPNTGKPLECWVWETWYPAEMCGPRETWNYEFMGVYPQDCGEECCNHGYWGLRSPITTHGQYIDLTEATLDCIRQKQFFDLEWSILSETERLRELDSQLARDKEMDAEEAWKRFNEDRDHYLSHKQKEDNADNRVYAGLGVTTKGGKMPIGKPKL